MNYKIIATSLMTTAILASTLVAPVATAVSADVISQNTSAVTKDAIHTQSLLESETLPEGLQIVYLDEKGVEHIYNPYFNSLFSTGIISIGLKFTYTSKADGQNLKSTFENIKGAKSFAYICEILGVSAGGTVGAIVSILIGNGISGLVSRCIEGIAAVDAHPNSGAIYMYMDHVT